MLTFKTTSTFRKDLKRMIKRGCDKTLINNVIKELVAQKKLAPEYRDHELSGSYIGFRECHIRPDWLLIYKIEKDELILTAIRTGSHSDLF